MSAPANQVRGAGGSPLVSSGPTGEMGKPTNDERLFAALAYLSYLVGFWFIGPLAIYGLKGRTSPFVRFHAGQALVTTLAVVIGVMVAAVIFIVGGVITFALGAATESHTSEIVFSLIRVIAGAFFALVPTLLLVVAAIRAHGGSTKPVPIVGRFAKPIQEPLFRVVDSIASSGSGTPPQGGTPG